MLPRTYLLTLAAALSIIGMLGGCASKQDETPLTEAPPVDERFTLTNQAARLAFDNGQYKQAAALYEKALAIAYTRDDVAAVIDAQHNAAVCYVKMDDNAKALTFVANARGELIRAGAPVSSDFTLLEATIRYRLGESDAAWRLTQDITAADTNTNVFKRAQFLRGLIAADRNDITALRASLASLANPIGPRLTADFEELSGYVALTDDRLRDAQAAFVRAARLRGDTVDYRGVVRALRMAGNAAERDGRLQAAANHYLRGGRSAAVQGDTANARPLLTRAAELSQANGDSETQTRATALLDQLTQTSQDE